MPLNDQEYRDEVAARVMQELVSTWSRNATGHIAPFPGEANARQAFDIADALVAERRRREKG